MSYKALTTAEIAVKKPVTNALMTKVKGNFDYLYSEAGGAPQLPVNGSFETDTDGDGIPDNWTRSLYPGGSGGLYTAAPAHGAKAAYFTHPGGAGNGGGYLTSSYIEVSQLQTLALFYILWCTAAGMRNLVTVDYYTAAKASNGNTHIYDSTSNPTSATLYCSQFTPPANTRYIKIHVLGGYSETDVAGTAYFDGLWLVPAVVTDLIQDASINQAKLKNSTQSAYIERTGPGGTGHSVALTGGSWCFQAQTKISAQTLTDDDYYYVAHAKQDEARHNTTLAAYVWLYIYSYDSGQWARVHYLSRYITASGEIHWVFILRDKETGHIIAASESPDHPCFGNGGKPLLRQHPFADYDPKKHEIIVINPSHEEVAQMRLATLIEDEAKPDRNLIEVMTDDYEINEYDEIWPDIPVTVGLPLNCEMKKVGDIIVPVKKIIPKPDFIKVKSLKKR
jgi:hypothetical protein